MELTKEMLISPDGTNKAVRAFLIAYKDTQEMTINNMRGDLDLLGFPNLVPPELQLVNGNTHLTTWASSIWLKYLFNLEKSI